MPGLDVGERREEEHDQRRVPVDERLSALESDVLALRDEVARLNAARERQGLEPPSLEPHAKRLRLASPRLVLQALQQAKLKAAALLVPAPMGEWAPGGRVWDALAVALLLLIAIPLRFVHLGSVPFGFHGDEAAVGLEAQRILQRGWIGPYSGEAGGTPAGPYYAAAVAIHFLGNTVFAARFAAAVFDTLTVVLVYVLARRNFGWGSAVIAGLFTAVSIWQLEFARLAFINSAWPFCVVAGAAALCEAIRTRSPVWWAAAGALAASGLYAYPAHALFLGVLALFLLIHFAGLFGVVALGAFAAAYLAGGPVGFAALTAGAAALALNRRLRNRTVLKEAAAFCVSFVVVAWPIIQFARKNRETFFRTGRGVSVFEDEKWSSMHGAGARAWWLVGRYFEFWDRAIRHPAQDGIDGTGAAPLIPTLFAVLCVVGLWLAWRRRSQPLVLLGGLVVVLMPLAVATSNNFPLRRAAAITPFMAIFAAVAIVEFIRSTWRKGFFVRFAALLLVFVVSGQVVYRDLDGYFNKTAASPGMYWTLAGDLVNSVDFIKTLPRDSYVYFYAERWPFDSGERLFLAPEVQGESRGQEFGDHSLALDPANGRPVVVLIGKYEALLPVFQMMHPNGSFEYGAPVPGTNGEPSFIAFFPVWTDHDRRARSGARIKPNGERSDEEKVNLTERGEERRLRVGVLGCGQIAQAAHFEACRKARNAQLYAICDVAPDLLVRMSVVHQPVVAYDNYNEMLADANVDAVIVAVADQFHIAAARQAVEAGKHVLIEKPLGVSVEECEALREVVERVGVVAQVGTMKRFDPGIAFARDFIEQEMGERLAVKAWYCDSTHRYVMTDNVLPIIETSQNARRPVGNPKEDRRRYLLLGHGSHLVDTARHLGGPIKSVQAHLVEKFGAYSWFVETDFEDGSNGHLDLTVAVRMDWWEGFTVYGEFGSVVGKTYNPWYFKSSDVECFSERDGQYRRVLGADAHFYRLQLEAFADTILNGAPMRGADVNDGLAAVKTLVAIARSAETGERWDVASATGAV